MKAEALSVKAVNGSTEAKLKTQADAIKAIEANPVAEKATATAPVTADAPEAKPRATSTAEPLSVNTAFVARQVTTTETASEKTKFRGMPLADVTGAGAKATASEAAGAKTAKGVDAQVATYAQTTVKLRLMLKLSLR